MPIWNHCSELHLMGVPLFWHKSDNFGDALAPWIVRRLSGEEPTFTDWRSEGAVPYLVTGSILDERTRRGIVWGAGSAFSQTLNPAKIAPPSDSFQVIAVRGPLIAKSFQAAGHHPRAIGDPGLLLKRLYTPIPKVKCHVGVVCSWVDYVEVEKHYRDVVPVLNASTPVEEFLDTIASWDIIISSCLHGLVVGVAYEKPVVWAKFSDRMVGDDFKFQDFFATFNEQPNPVFWPTMAELELHAKTFDLPNLDGLYECCPFRIPSCPSEPM